VTALREVDAGEWQVSMNGGEEPVFFEELNR